ncbi:MAG TPA: hypothetical protein PLU24_04605 [Candidatus Omnitrophota bacterium]|nr:hypothetical protein [Candidatus Omnitrophota bacterium]
MKKTRVLGISLLLLAVLTVVGMVLQSDAFWNFYNYLTLVICIFGGVSLLKQK